MIDLSRLDKYVQKFKPDNFESVLYLFWEKGIDFNQFCDLPIPYIIAMLNTFDYVKKEEEKAHKKAMKKK